MMPQRIAIVRKCLLALSAGLLCSEARAGMITAGDAFRFIRADAVIDADGDGAAEVWDVETASAPSPFGAWTANVDASATFSIPGVGEGLAVASSQHSSRIDVFDDHALISGSGIIESVVQLSGAARDHGTFDGFPRSSGPFVNFWFDFHVDSEFAYEIDGTFSSHWTLQDRSTFATVAWFIDGPVASGVIGPGTYRFSSTSSGGGNFTSEYSFEFSLDEPAPTSVPEPASAALLGLGALGMGRLVRRRRMHSPIASSKRPCSS